MSGLIPQHFIDELVARTDIVEIIGRRVPLRRAGREYSACCPFHDEKTPSFTVSPIKQFYHCFGCGAHGTAVSFLMEHDHMGFVDAVEELAAAAGLEVPREAGPPGPDAGLYDLMERASSVYRDQLGRSPKARAYVRERGLGDELCAEFGLGFAPEGWDTLAGTIGRDAVQLQSLVQVGLVVDREADDGRTRRYDRFRKRIMFPIRDARGRVIAFGGRVFGQAGERDPKYLNSPETPLFHKGRELYGLYEMRKALREIKRVVVVEGYMDVLALAQHGIRYAVATLGTATTTDHLDKLFRVCDEIVFCFDGDRAGRAAAWRALQNALPGARAGRQLRFLFVPDGHDPDSLVRDEGAQNFEARLEHAVPMSDFLVDHLSEGLDLSSVDSRARLAELARPLIEKIPEGIYRQLVLDRLSESVRLSSERLEALLPAGAPDTLYPTARAGRQSRRGAAGAGRDSLVRRAIRLVVNHPRIAATVADPRALLDVDLPGVGLLVELLEDAGAHPNIHTAGLIERWREHELGRHLAKLAGGNLLIDEGGAESELNDLVARLLNEEGPARRRAVLLAKARREDLDASEKVELKRLLDSRGGGATQDPH